MNGKTIILVSGLAAALLLAAVPIWAQKAPETAAGASAPAPPLLDELPEMDDLGPSLATEPLDDFGPPLAQGPGGERPDAHRRSRQRSLDRMGPEGFDRDRRPGPGGPQGPGGPGGPVRMLSEEQLEILMEVVEEVRPELAERLAEGRERNPEHFQRRVAMHVWPHFRELVRLRMSDTEADRELYELKVIDMRIGRETREIRHEIMKLKRSDTERAAEELEELRDKVHELVAEHFDVRQKIREQELERLEHRLKELRQDIESRRANREAMIDSRVKELVGEVDQPRW